ncbi:MAG: hypothetical protein ACI8UO_001366 [Verrucomicrobiales bacterium]|jgi:hypothetical protein
MKSLAFHIAAILIVGAVAAEEQESPDLKIAASLRFVEAGFRDVRDGNDEIIDRVFFHTISDDQPIDEANRERLLTALKDGAEPENGMHYPLIGTLVKFVIFDQDGVPIYVCAQVNWNSTLSVRPILKVDKKEIFTSPETFTMRRPDFTKLLVEALERSAPEIIKKAKESYKSVGQDFEDLIFRGHLKD